MAININEDQFDQAVTQSDMPVLVDFWAPWCGPCKALAPTLDELSNEYEGRARIVKINVDDNPNLASQFRIRSIPTMVIFKAGAPVDLLQGQMPKKDIAAALDRQL